MILEAYNIGVGSCWVMHFDPAAIKSEFNIPDNIKALAVLVMGYPSDEATPHEFHDKYRSLDEIVVYDKF